MQVLDPNKAGPNTERLPYSLAERFFQLQELEDQESSTTQVHLNWDNTVTLGETDGPRFVAGHGTWKYNPDTSAVDMTVTRRYAAGHVPSSLTDMGEFDFAVTRVLTGQVEWTGNKVSVAGSIHYYHATRGDEKVGYFTMLDTSPERMEQQQRQQQQKQ